VGLKKCDCNLLSNGEIDSLRDEAAAFERFRIAEFARNDTNERSSTIHQGTSRVSRLNRRSELNLGTVVSEPAKSAYCTCSNIQAIT
jgi:hypothetical protein